MARYQITESATVTTNRETGELQYFAARPDDAQIINLPDDVEPSREWLALDDAAEKAQQKLVDWDNKKPEERAKLAAERAREDKKKRREAALKAAKVQSRPAPFSQEPAPSEDEAAVTAAKQKRANESSPL